MSPSPRRLRKKVTACVVIALAACLVYAGFAVFFDEAVFLRQNTIYRGGAAKKLVALTFDDGPSPEWTPQILEELRKADVKATFFMLGKHVEAYPDVARAVAAAGHEIGNHTYDHRVLLYFTPAELTNALRRTDEAIRAATGQTTRCFRPPKAWLTTAEKEQIRAMGYETVLWSLNSKDWVRWDDKLIVKYLVHHVTGGDIILFHDSGGVFKAQGGDRHQTVQAIPRLIKALRAEGYRFVTVSELQKEDPAPAAPPPPAAAAGQGSAR